MAIRTPINMTATNEDQRTWRATIDTPATGAYSITVNRETVKRDAQENIVGEPQRGDTVFRVATDIQSETVTVTVNGQDVVVSAALIMLALPKFFDRWAQEDQES